jgi:hypothetical protein
MSLPPGKDQNYKQDNCTRNLVGRSFGRCLRSRLSSGCSMRFITRPFGGALRPALYGRHEDENIPMLLPKTEIQLLGRPAFSLVAVPTELS